MPLVLDPSAIAPLAFDDEDPEYAEAVVDAITTDHAVVPSLWWLEIRNLLIMAERRRRSTPAQTAAFLADLATLPISFDQAPQDTVVMALARAQGLTVYDAAYLELAQRKGLALATLDNKLRKAAKAVSVPVFRG